MQSDTKEEVVEEPGPEDQVTETTDNAGNNEEASNIVHLGHNGKDYPGALPFAERIVNLEIEMEAIMKEAKQKCSPHRDDIKEVKGEATDAGFGKKAFNALLAELRLKRKIEAIPTNMEDDHAEEFEQLSLAWVLKHEESGE